MAHPFPQTAVRNAQSVPSFLERTRLTIDEIRKDPFKLTRQRSRLKPAKKEERINSATTVSLDISKCKVIQGSLRRICEELGWKCWNVPRKLGLSDIYWQAHQIEEFAPYARGGAINKYPQMAETLRKINLTRSLCNLRLMFPDEYDFHPRTWFLPQQFHELCADVAYEKRNSTSKGKKKGAAPTFIVKPDGGTQGEGIYLIRDPHDYVLSKGNGTHVVQDYISNPFLLDKMKFDLRIYVVVLSLNPVKIYLSREGLARFCTVQYREPTNKNINDSFMHLTNYSLNKNSDTYIHTDRLTDGSKRTIASVMSQLAKLGHDTYQLWADIEQVVIKTMLAVTPELQIAQNLTLRTDSKVKCFQILGFDIILTDKLKPILLEVNANPSLSMTYDREVAPGIYDEVPSAVDKHVKYKLIKETLLLAAPRHKVEHQLPTLSVPTPPEELTGYESLFADESNPENFLYEVYPGVYEENYGKLRILERLAAIYQTCLGLHEQSMSTNSFRMFARRCCIVHQSSSLTVAALDIMFIEIMRRFSDLQMAEAPTGLSFQAFLEAFLIIAKRSKLKSPNLHEMVDNLLHYCEANLELSSRPKLRRAKLPKISVVRGRQDALSSRSRHRVIAPGSESG